VAWRSEAGWLCIPSIEEEIQECVVMGQFNYADSSSGVDNVIFWTQKNRERFATVVAAGPFSEEHMLAFEENSIDAISNHNDIVNDDGVGVGFYTPLENLKNMLLHFKDSLTIME
jgi:hypothetical protein